MDSGDKALLATLFIVLFLIVCLSFTLAPIWLLSFLVLLGVIALAVFKGKKEETLLPTQDQALIVNARADNAADVALRPAVDAFVNNLRRQPVNKQVERVSSRIHGPLLRAPSDPVGTSEASSLRLQFVTELPKVIFTNSQIEAVDNTPLRIELVNGRTNERITSGCLSSIKIEIVVLDGKFGSDKGEDWTEEEFNCKITHGRKGPLIIGELAVVLQGGSGCLHNLSITHHSKRKRSKKFRAFRLGARATQQVSVETRIREARSEAFIVQSFQGEKHYPPNLSDEVWRLEKVARDGHRRKLMASRKIITVQDFLQRYEANEFSLRNILGKAISKESWKEMVSHARTCVVDDNKMYAYTRKKDSIIFNSVMKVAQATLDGKTYQSVDELTDKQKDAVQKLKSKAYDRKEQWVALDALRAPQPTCLHSR